MGPLKKFHNLKQENKSNKLWEMLTDAQEMDKMTNLKFKIPNTKDFLIACDILLLFSSFI